MSPSPPIPRSCARADRIVLPGVGAFAACIGALAAVPGMVEALDEAVRGAGAPFLGVCVGMQLLADAGEEHGRHAGLGWIGGTVRLLAPADAGAEGAAHGLERRRPPPRRTR